MSKYLSLDHFCHFKLFRLIRPDLTFTTFHYRIFRMEDPIQKILREWLAPLEGNWPSLYLVGGAVRDRLLARPARDLDLVCRNAKEFARRVAKTRDATVVPFEKRANEPCYRIVDRQKSDTFVDLSPIKGESIVEDLSSRDFTINAMAYEVRPEGELSRLIDPLEGLLDLEQRIIRITGPGAFSSDPLRILRAPRFAASLDSTIEQATMGTMKEEAFKLEKVAGERIWAELLEILRSPGSSRLVRLMDRLEIMTVLFPEVKAMKGCAQNFFHHLDVWDHSLAVLENCEGLAGRLEDYFGPAAANVKDNIMAHNRLPLMKMAALFHDVAKPATRDVDKDSDRITFYGHQREGQQMAGEIAGRLRMSKRDQGFFATLIGEHMHVLNLSSPEVRPATRLKWFRKLKDDCVPLIILGIADMEATLGPASAQKRRENHIQWSKESVKAYYGEIKQKLERRDLIAGKDLLGLGIPPGPEMGRILRKVREAQDIGEINDREEALALAGELNCVRDKRNK